MCMRPVVGFEDFYSVTRDGKVWSHPNKLGGAKMGKWIKSFRHYKGYLVYYLQHLTKRRIIFAHKIVALAFIPNPLSKKELNHKNGIKTDNRVENLEWCTHLENMQHAYKNGFVKINRGSNHGMAKLTEKQVLEIRQIYRDGKPRQKD